jgi:hypothetical protein
MREKCKAVTKKFNKEMSSIDSQRNQEILKKITIINDKLEDGEINKAQAAIQDRAVRAEANKKPYVQDYRKCMAQRCEDAMYAMAASIIAYIQESIEDRRKKRQPLTKHKKKLAELNDAVRKRTVTPKLVAEALTELHS